MPKFLAIAERLPRYGLRLDSVSTVIPIEPLVHLESNMFLTLTIVLYIYYGLMVNSTINLLLLLLLLLLLDRISVLRT